jgi:WD40 repeat protein
MVQIRTFFALVIVLSLGAAACTSRDLPTPQATATTVPQLTETSHPTSTEVTTTTPCFPLKELLPFAFSPDSSLLVGRVNQGVQFIDILTGQRAATIDAPRGVLTAALSPDGDTLAWSLDDNTIQLVKIPEGTIRFTLVAHPDPVLDLRFSPTGSALFSASHDGTVRVWDTATGAALPPFEVGLEVLGIGVSPDGSVLAVVPSYGPVQLWDIDTRRLIREVGGTGAYDTSDVSYSPDGRYLVADLATGIFLWDLNTQKEIWSSFGNSMAVAYSPNDDSLAYVDIDSGNRVYLGPIDGQGDFAVVDQMQGPAWELFFSPDGRYLAAADGIEVRVWAIPERNRALTGTATCSEDDSARLAPAPSLRQFDPAESYIASVPYPDQVASLDDDELVPMACTPDYFSWSGTDHEYIDPSTQERFYPADPRIETYLESARKLNPGAIILSISLCDLPEAGPLVIYRAGPCGGGCAGTPNIARGDDEGALAWIARVEPNGDGAYFSCRPLQLSSAGDLALSCEGEGTASLRNVSLESGEVDVIIRCDLSSSIPSCLTN